MRMVFLELGWVGDTVVTIPAMRSIREKFSEAEIIRVCSPTAESMLRNCPYIDRLLIYDREGEHKGIQGRLRFLRLVREIKPDIFINLHVPDINRTSKIFLRDNIFSILTASKIRVGYASPGTKFLLSHDILANKSHLSKYIVDLINELTKKLSCEPTQNLELWISNEERDYVSEILKKYGVGSGEHLIAIHPGAKRPSRRWPISRFIEIARWLGKKNRVVITGSKDEANLSQQIFDSNSGVVIASGTLTLMQTAALLEKCSLFTTNDTGIMHMAFALKVPTVALFGPGDVLRWVPPKKNWIRVIHHPVPCSPCYRWECEDLSCMKAITVDEVKEAILKMLRLNANHA